MSDTRVGTESQGVAEAAVFTSELAAANIRKYLELHTGEYRKWNMKILEGVDERSKQIASDAAKLAAESLQAFVDAEERHE